jgi:hypothetical protein
MKSLTASDAVRDWLNGVLEQVEIRDSSGKLLGHFTPALTDEEKTFYAQAESLFDAEELDRIERTELEGYPFEEVMRRLERAETQEVQDRA